MPPAVLASPLPALSRRYALVLVASFVLYVGAAVSGRNSRRQEGEATLWRLRTFLAWGAGVALLHGRFHPNDLAGVLVLFLPLVLALAMSPGLTSGQSRRGERRLWRLQLLLLTGLFGVLLLSTQSRGALLAVAVAVSLVLWLERRRRLLAFAALAAAGTALVARRWLVDAFLLSGAAQGVTAAVVLTGRPAIWDRALLALGDFPIMGVGPGAFGDVAAELYALGGRVGDAHNLYLQVALDLGVAGLVAFLVFVAAVLRQASLAVADAPVPGLRRSRRIGILAALVAFLLHGSVDAVAPGTVGAMALFFLCGLATAEKTPRRSNEARHGWAWLVVVLLVVGFLLSPLGRVRLHLNRAASIAAGSLLSDPSRLDAASEALAAVPLCRARWLQGLLAHRRGLDGERDSAWTELVGCSMGHFDLLEQVAPAHPTLAERAVEAQPLNADCHLYLARTLQGSKEDAGRAMASFRRGLALDPRDARAWLELADLLAVDDRRAALDAYEEACRRGDPGANACWRGGRTAEALGEPRTAIRLYGRSRWLVARQRGEELVREWGARPSL